MLISLRSEQTALVIDNSEAGQQPTVQGQEMETFNCKSHMGTPRSESLNAFCNVETPRGPTEGQATSEPWENVCSSRMCKRQ